MAEFRGHFDGTFRNKTLKIELTKKHRIPSGDYIARPVNSNGYNFLSLYAVPREQQSPNEQPVRASETQKSLTLPLSRDLIDFLGLTNGDKVSILGVIDHLKLGKSEDIKQHATKKPYTSADASKLSEYGI